RAAALPSAWTDAANPFGAAGQSLVHPWRFGLGGARGRGQADGAVLRRARRCLRAAVLRVATRPAAAVGDVHSVAAPSAPRAGLCGPPGQGVEFAVPPRP